jgi:hypothetical protein
MVAGRKYFQVTFKEIFRILVIAHVIKTIGIFIVQIFELLRSLENGKELFIQLLGEPVFFLGIEFVRF